VVNALRLASNGPALRWVQRLLLALACGLLLACSDKQGLPEGKTTGDYIHQFYVDGAWGGNVFAYGGGGGFVCCIVYPEQWQAGLKAKVRWTTSSSDPQSNDATETWHELTVPIDKYDKPGTTLNVHFLPEGQVRLVISSMSSAHPDYPGPRLPPKPKDYKW
jgi:Protein of unknown function (DUF3304)